MVPRSQHQPDWYSILVVDDEVLVRFVVAEHLREAGLTVIEAASADEAWSYLVTGRKVDLVFSDVVMPGQMNGVDLANRIEAEIPDLPVILTSGTHMPQNDASPLRLFLMKPYRVDTAASLVLQTLGLEQPDGDE